MAFQRDLGDSNTTTDIAAQLTRARGKMPRLFSTKPRTKLGTPLKPNVRLIGIDHATGKVRYIPTLTPPGRGLTSASLVNRHTIDQPQLSGPPARMVKGSGRGLSPGLLINRHTQNVYTLAGTRASLTTYGGAEQGASWGLGAADDPRYQTVNVPLENLVGPQLPGLGRSFFGDIGAAVSKAVSDAGRAIGRNAAAVAKVALPVFGAILAPVTGGASLALGSVAAGLLNKAKRASTQVQPALASGPSAVADVIAQHNQIAAQAQAILSNPNSTPDEIALANALNQYATGTVTAINTGITQANGVLGGSVPPTIVPASTVLSGGLPAWALPAAVAAAAILMLRR